MFLPRRTRRFLAFEHIKNQQHFVTFGLVKAQPKLRDRLHARLEDLVDFLGVAFRFGQPNDLPIIRHAENKRTAQRVRKSAYALAPAFGLFTSSAAFLSYSVVSPIRFSISICSDHFLREISVLLLYNFAGAVCNRKLYSPVLSCTHHGKIPAVKSGFVCFADKIGLVFASLVFYLFSYLFVQAFPVREPYDAGIQISQ